MYCKYCGAHYLEGAVVCPSCGEPTEEVERLLKQSGRTSIPPQSKKATHCKFCGARYEDGSLYCPSCNSPTDEGEMLLAQSALSSDKKRFSGYTLAADIISLVMLAFTAVFRLKAQSTIYAIEAAVPDLNPALSTYFLQVKLIVAVIVVVMMIVALCLAEASKKTSPRGRTDTVLVSLFAGAASLGLIFLLK